MLKLPLSVKYQIPPEDFRIPNSVILATKNAQKNVILT